MKILINWLISTFAILCAAYLISGVHIASFITALLIALALGVVNALLRPLLLLLTLPINILTLGLFTFVINALMVLLVAWFIPGFSVASFWTALIFSIVLALINALLGWIFKGAEK